MAQQRLAGRVAIITGAARGIGKATAIKMNDEGASVILVDILADELHQAEKELNVRGGKAIGIKADIRNRKEVETAVQRTLEHFGKVDILVNNAGIVSPAPLEHVKEEDWDSVVSVNFKGTFLCTLSVLPSMKQNRYGKIVNIGSRASLGKPDRTVYAATKAGLIGMTRTWALELASHNINVNYVGPGPIATELYELVNPKESEKTKALVRNIPLQRIGEPKDVANAICFLASDEAGFITGQTLFICGGLTVGPVHY